MTDETLKGYAVLASCTPKHSVWNSVKARVLGERSQVFSQIGDKSNGCDARQKHVRSGFGRREA
jgi:hypothetical protein